MWLRGVAGRDNNQDKIRVKHFKNQALNFPLSHMVMIFPILILNYYQKVKGPQHMIQCRHPYISMLLQIHIEQGLPWWSSG